MSAYVHMMCVCVCVCACVECHVNNEFVEKCLCVISQEREQTYSTIPKSLERGCSEASSLSGSAHIFICLFLLMKIYTQVYKHIFTLPSSVEKEMRATRSGNTHIHGMTQVTTASLAYIATQVHLVPKIYHLPLIVQPALLCIVIFINIL
jgi:hypothetical protein